MDPWATRPPTIAQLLAVVGGEVRAARLALGWSQRKLERASGVDQTTISRLERGKLPHLQLMTLVLVFGALDLHMARRECRPERGPTDSSLLERDWSLESW